MEGCLGSVFYFLFHSLKFVEQIIFAGRGTRGEPAAASNHLKT
jgi:hypothetical protein